VSIAAGLEKNRLRIGLSITEEGISIISLRGSSSRSDEL
jgi:hypothetical protein